MSPHLHYPDLAKSKPVPRKDALVPDPQEYDMSDPERSRIAPLSVKDRLNLFARLVADG